MNDETNLAPLPSEVSSLLEEERARPGPPPEVEERMYGRLAVALGLPPGPAGPGGSGGTSSATGAPPADPGLASGGVSMAASAGANAGLSKLVLAAVFAAGAVAGSVTTHLLHQHASPPARAAQREASQLTAKGEQIPHARAIVPSRAAPSGRAEDPAPPTVEVVKSAAPSQVSWRALHRATDAARQPATAQESVGDHQLAAERVLVERARSALVRSRPADALAAVKQHHKNFPAGRLTEEREAIRVLALVAQGEHYRARRVAKSFRQRYPHSLLRPMVDTALQARPAQAGDREKPRNLR